MFPTVIRRYTRVGYPFMPPDVLTSVALLADDYVILTCEPKDLCFIQPVRARWALAREHLSPY